MSDSLKGKTPSGTDPRSAELTKFNPEMLVLARESRRMTQIALAKKSGTSQGAISKAENGLVVPELKNVEAWAEALRYPASLFSRTGVSASLPVTFFRKQASLPAAAAKAIAANVALHREHIDRLVRPVELGEAMVTPTSPSEVNRSPSELAQEIRHAWRLPRGPLANLTKAIEDAGIIVVAIDFGADKVDGLSVWERLRGSPPIMFINTRSPADRIRFTMAHELGHIVMHHHQAIPPDTSEDEANEFASELLMPRADIGAQLHELSIERLAQLKLHWRVSMASLLVRAKNLERLSERRSTMLWKKFSALGYRTREPVEISREEPELVKELVRVHIEDLDYTADDLASSLDLFSDELRECYLGERPGLRLVPKKSG